jgi:hypothetical protein
MIDIYLGLTPDEMMESINRVNKWLYAIHKPVDYLQLFKEDKKEVGR